MLQIKKINVVFASKLEFYNAEIIVIGFMINNKFKNQVSKGGAK